MKEYLRFNDVMCKKIFLENDFENLYFLRVFVQKSQNSAKSYKENAKKRLTRKCKYCIFSSDSCKTILDEM